MNERAYGRLGSGFDRNSYGKLPKMHFPQFDGDNPKLWKTRCENYFDMYGVDESLWIKVATMHFSGVAARWLQAVERKLKGCSWYRFCNLIDDRFGRDQHETLICQLFNIKQIGSASAYVEKFSELVDQLTAYESHTDTLYYTMKFVDGLRDDIKSTIMVQRPSNLDTACSLALVQEETAESMKKKSIEKIMDIIIIHLLEVRCHFLFHPNWINLWVA